MTPAPFYERYQTEAGAAAYAHKYEKSLARRLSLRREIRCVGRALRAAGASGTILDLPCGAGRFTPLIRGMADRYLPSDLSLPMVELCLGPDRAGGAFLADAHRIPLADRAVDGVAAVRLIHHFPDPEERRALLREFARISRRFLVVTFLDAGSVKQRLHGWKGRRLGRPSRRATVSRREIAADLAGAGFRAVGFFSLSTLFSGQTAVAAIRGAAG
jgi:SAM-dependent methyltransferase